MTELTNFQRDIRPLFTDRDIHAMSKAFDLASYDDVRAHAAAIYDRIRGKRSLFRIWSQQEDLPDPAFLP
jgi:hypothetical protein